jgi:hypothetical protein
MAHMAKAQKKEKEGWLAVQGVAVGMAEPPPLATRGGFASLNGWLGVASLWPSLHKGRFGHSQRVVFWGVADPLL